MSTPLNKNSGNKPRKQGQKNNVPSIYFKKGDFEINVPINQKGLVSKIKKLVEISEQEAKENLRWKAIRNNIGLFSYVILAIGIILACLTNNNAFFSTGILALIWTVKAIFTKNV